MLKELNQVIDYIEDRLTDDLSLERISEYAGVSDYHFRKIFFYLSGLTLNEHIKNRKLSEANKNLLNGEKVTDVAFNYGYQSVDGFSTAFKKWSGFLPSDVIKKGISKSFPKLSFVIIVREGTAMEFRIIFKILLIKICFQVYLKTTIKVKNTMVINKFNRKRYFSFFKKKYHQMFILTFGYRLAGKFQKCR